MYVSFDDLNYLNELVEALNNGERIYKWNGTLHEITSINPNMKIANRFTINMGGIETVIVTAESDYYDVTDTMLTYKNLQLTESCAPLKLLYHIGKPYKDSNQ